MDFAKTLALSSYGRLTVMAVQLTAILLGHAQPFNNSCRAHELERAVLTSSASLRSMACKSDSWILLRRFSSRVMAGSPVMAVLDSSEDRITVTHS